MVKPIFSQQNLGQCLVIDAAHWTIRQATAAQRHDAPVPWRVRAAEALRVLRVTKKPWKGPRAWKIEPSNSIHVA